MKKIIILAVALLCTIVVTNAQSGMLRLLVLIVCLLVGVSACQTAEGQLQEFQMLIWTSTLSRGNILTVSSVALI